MNVKQVIVMRKDLKMRRGKEIAQGSHASMAFITRRMQALKELNDCKYGYVSFSPPEIEWLNESFTKVCLQVNSEQELLDVVNQAKQAGLQVHMVTDAGKTEFNGVPTNTCCAIGPDESEKIDKITGHLTLY